MYRVKLKQYHRETRGHAGANDLSNFDRKNRPTLAAADGKDATELGLYGLPDHDLCPL